MTILAGTFGVDNTFLFHQPRFVRIDMVKFDNHFSDLFENTSDLIQVLAYDGTIELVNSSWLKSLGYTEAEVIGNSVYDFVMPEYKDQYQRQRMELIDTDDYDRYVEVVFRGKDGRQLIGEGHTRRVIGEGGAIYTRGVFHDITSRRALEEQNFETQNRLKRFFEYAPDAIIIADEQQRITDWNLKAACTFGFTAEEILGRKLGDAIIPEKYREAHKKGVAEVFKSGKGTVLNNTIEVEAMHKNGHVFPISLSISNVKMGNEWMFVAFISDITDRKRQEEKVRLQNESLNRIANIQSHEVRGPIASIMGLINLIKDDNYTVPKEYVEMMEEELHKLDERTRTIVGYANRPVLQAG